MTRNAALRLALTLALMFLFGITSVVASPNASHIGYVWPVGLAAGALVLSPRRLTAHVAVAVAVLAALSFALGGYPVAVSVGYSIGIALEALVARLVLSPGWTQRLRLRDANDLSRFALACVLAATTAALVFAAVSAATSFGTAWKVGVSVFVTHAVGQAVLLGLFREAGADVASYGAKRRVLAWVLTVAMTSAAFVPTDQPSLAFLVFPLLGWVAFRARQLEAMIQLVVVSVIASTMTNVHRGPFSDPSALPKLDPEFSHLPLEAFLLACAMVSIPFSMAVGMQRRSAAQLLAERARVERLVQSARGIAIIGTDVEGRINLFSPGAQLILGYRPEEVFGRSTRMFHTDAEIARQAEWLGVAPTYLDVVEALTALPPGSARELEFVRKDGVARILSTILSPVTDEDGQLTGYVATADDVTDRLATQSALEGALETEREAVRRLTEVDQVKDRFVSSVSHELRTPITNIVGYLELLLEGVYGAQNDDQAQALTRIEMNSRRLLALIDDLLTISSIETLDQPPTMVATDLATVMRRAEEIVRPALLHRDLELALEMPTEEVTVYGDSGQLERLVINLATNAIKFTLDGGRVTMRVRAPHNGTGPVIEVEDTGIGIPEADQEMLFSRFFRAAQAREAAVPGSGLGLSIAKSIAELHGGQISATSVYGTGSTFRVEFPATAGVRERSAPGAGQR